MAATQPASSIDWEEKRKTWVKQADALYKQVRGWLSEHSKNGHISPKSQRIKLSDANVGDYDIGSLELALVGDHKVIFEPVEMNFLGAVGRVDLYHRGNNSHKVMLLLRETSKDTVQWELWKGVKKDEQRPFNKDSLEALINSWIG